MSQDQNGDSSQLNEKGENPVERVEERKEQEIVQQPTADEGGPLGNVTNAVTENEPVDTVVKKSEERIEEKPASPDNASER